MADTEDRVTDQDIHDAELAATKAQRHADVARELFLDSEEGLTWDDVKTADAAADTARMHAERLRRTKARQDAAARQDALAALRREIDAYTAPSGFVDLLHAVEDATVAFAKAHADHNDHVADWIERLADLGVDRNTDPARNQGLGITPTGAVRAGTRDLQRVDSGQTLQELLAGLGLEHGLGNEYFTAPQHWHPAISELYARVAGAAAERPNA